jgi:hypothetical protein
MRVALLGPIGYWWDDQWDTPAHREYVAWRDQMRTELVAAGHLVYSPHRAWQGEWDANDGDSVAQIVNDTAIAVCDAVLNLTPPSVPSPGTDHEMALCKRVGIPVVVAPPGNAHVFDALNDAVRENEALAL